MRDILLVLEHWGGWTANDNSGMDYQHIAAGFKGLMPETCKSRPSCTDNDGLIIESCLARLRDKKRYEHDLLVAHYFYRISKRKIAKIRKKDEKQFVLKCKLQKDLLMAVCQ